MKARDLRERTTEDLIDLERSLSFDRFQNRFRNFTNRLDDTSLIRKNRRDLARVKLILLERKLGAVPLQSSPKPEPKPAKVVEEPKVETKAEVTEKTVKKPAKSAAPKTKKAAEPKEPKAKPAAKKAKPSKREESR
jgi:large subunit ribosomal protein L29